MQHFCIHLSHLLTSSRLHAEASHRCCGGVVKQLREGSRHLMAAQAVFITQMDTIRYMQESLHCKSTLSCAWIPATGALP